MLGKSGRALQGQCGETQKLKYGLKPFNARYTGNNKLTTFERDVVYRYICSSNAQSHVPEGWRVETVDPQWNNDHILSYWLQRHFISATRPYDGIEFRILFIDGRVTNRSESIDMLCQGNKIIPIYFPRNSSHLFLSLDISSLECSKNFYASYIRRGESKNTNRTGLSMLQEYARDLIHYSITKCTAIEQLCVSGDLCCLLPL